jgi:hypothetical protein
VEACFMVWGLGTGPVCVDCAAHLVLRRSGWLLSRLGVVVVGVLGSAGPGRCLVNLKGDSSSKHLSCPGSWALDPCASIAPPIPCFEEAVGYFRDLGRCAGLGWARSRPRQSQRDFFLEASFMAWGLGTGPVCVDWPAQIMLRRSPSLLSRLGLVVVGWQVWLGQVAASSISRGVLRGSMFYDLEDGLWTHSRRLGGPSVLSRSRWLLSRLGAVVVGVLGQAGPGRCLVNLEGNYSWKHHLWPGGWALDPCASIASPIPSFGEAARYFRDFDSLARRGPGCGEDVQRATCSWSKFGTRLMGSGPECVDCAARRVKAAGASLLSRL